MALVRPRYLESGSHDLVIYDGETGVSLQSLLDCTTMDTAEARSILNRELAKYRAKSYGELVALINNVETLEVAAPSGTRYQLEFQATWDDPA